MDARKQMTQGVKQSPENTAHGMKRGHLVHVEENHRR